jgi:hypothetical protein
MAKVIDKGYMTKDDPSYFDGLTIGPIRIYRKSTKDGKPGSKDGKDLRYKDEVEEKESTP